MPDDTVPDELAQFVSKHIETYEQLEALRWLDAHGYDIFEPASLAESLRIPQSALEEALASFVRAKVLIRPGDARGAGRYQPATSEIDAKIRALAEYYQRNRLQVVRLMSENSMRRLRAATLQAFADCFLLGRSGKRG